MNIYRYVADSDRFECILPKASRDRTAVNKFVDCQPLSKSWKPFEVSLGSSKRAGDFPSLYTNVPVFSERAWNTLEPIISRSVEALPIKHPSSKPYYAINVLQVADCLDRDRSPVKLYPTGQVMRVVEYRFDPLRLPECSIFKLPETSGIEVYISDRFKSAVEEARLKGLIFQQMHPPRPRSM